VAPLEFTFLLDDWLRRQGIREKTEIVYTYPIGRVHSIPECAEWAQGELDRRGILSQVFFNLDRVDPIARRVESLEGTELTYDLLVAIPPHVGDGLGERSQLALQGNWYPTHPRRLTLEGYENIYILGDTTNLPVSKAGSVAHYEAEVVAENLSEALRGGTPDVTYDGKVFCFVEAGLDKATYIHFDYEHPPTVEPPTAAVHWFKQLYNRIHWLNLKAVV